MKKAVLIFHFLLLSSICSAQVQEISDVSSKYLFATIYRTDYLNHPIYNRSYFLNIFTLKDTQTTTEKDFPETDKVFDAILISITPDGDYYTSSKLYKINELIYPKIIEINETKYPEISIKIESGYMNKRSVKEYKIHSK